MSIRVMTEVWEYAPVEGTDLLLLLALADFSDDEGRSWPGLPRLARKARVKPRAAQYALRRLERAGLLTIDLNAGPRRTNRYTITIGAYQQPLGGRNALQGARHAPLHDGAPAMVHGGAPNPSDNRHGDGSRITTKGRGTRAATRRPVPDPTSRAEVRQGQVRSLGELVGQMRERMP